MHPLAKEFLVPFTQDNKAVCVRLVLDRLEKAELEIHTLYEQVLAPVLNSIAPSDQEQTSSIWQEHVRTGIIETIIACCYPYILKKSPKVEIAPTVLVFCPAEEYHQVGARMACDFFTLCGYHAVFIGANTPATEFLPAIKSLTPQYIVISISNYYNLVAAKRAIDQIRTVAGDTITIIVGGHAVSRNGDIRKNLGADLILQTYADVHALAKGDGLL